MAIAHERLRHAKILETQIPDFLEKSGIYPQRYANNILVQDVSKSIDSTVWVSDLHHPKLIQANRW